MERGPAGTGSMSGAVSVNDTPGNMGNNATVTSQASLFQQTSQSAHHDKHQLSQDHWTYKASPMGYQSQNGAAVGPALPKKKSKPSQSSPMLRYLRVRVRNLFHVPLAVLNKSACILDDETFIDILPVAWELLR